MTSWVPRRAVHFTVKVGVQFAARWMCEQFIRANCAYNAIQCGVNVVKSLESIAMRCRNKECSATLAFKLQPSSGLCKLKSYTEHNNECLGQSIPSLNCDTSASKLCSPSYTVRQVARAIISEATETETLNSKTIRALVRAKEIYKREPPVSHYRAIRREIPRILSAGRAVQMAAMEGYMKLLEGCGHVCTLDVISGVEMKSVRVKAAKHIFQQCKKGKTIPADAVFNEESVNVDDIKDNELYYAGFSFVPSTAAHMCKFGRSTGSADAAHCEGKGLTSYGTTFEVVHYDANYNLVPILFAYFVGAECYEYWKKVFERCTQIDNFDISQRMIIVDQEKSIDKAFDDCTQHAHLFLDPLHVKKNMSPILGSLRAKGLALYESALYAPSQKLADDIILQYSEKQAAYLSKYPKERLYVSYSNLEDGMLTSQGAESQMRASIRNQIRTVEPQKMLTNVIMTQRRNFLQHKRTVSLYDKPVPPRVEDRISHLLSRFEQYKSSIQWQEGSNCMEAKFLVR